MVVINEWLPNPVGPDAKAEWVELFNSASSSASIEGWHLKTSHAKKLFTLHGVMAPGEYLLLPKTLTKLSLRNTGEQLLLYDSSGLLVGQSSFTDTAPEGQSLSRRPDGTYIFTAPTPGAANVDAAAFPLFTEAHPFGVSLVPLPAFGQIFGLLLGVALCLTALSLFIIRHDLTNELFPGDTAAGGDVGGIGAG